MEPAGIRGRSVANLIGPIFVVAKLLVKPGMRRDLASYLAWERSRVLKQVRWHETTWPIGSVMSDLGTYCYESLFGVAHEHS
jgi:hypothetical protein